MNLSLFCGFSTTSLLSICLGSRDIKKIRQEHSLCFLMSLANGLSILFILSKNQLLVLLIFCYGPIPFSDTLMEDKWEWMILLGPYWTQIIPSTARILNYFCFTLYAMLFPLFLPNQGFIVYILFFIHCIGCTWGK